VIVTNAGETAPSENPSMKRTAAKLAKLWGAARHMQIAPQIILFVSVSMAYSALVVWEFYTVMPTSFVKGNFDMR
jgi:hypothetical protein